jgi:hypothetical protein
MGHPKLIIEHIRPLFEVEEYTLISTEIVDSKSYLKYKCPKGHYGKTTWNNWKKGNRCGVCFGNIKPIYEFIKQELNKEGYTLLSPEYKNNQTPLKFICPDGHRHKISWNVWQKGVRCGKCYKPKLTYKFIKQELNKEGYTLLSTEYKNNHSYLDFICPNGHKHKITWGSWQQGRRCGKCSQITSKQEREIRQWIVDKYPNITIKSNDRRTILNPKTGHHLELDIYLPILNKAIEYNSEYYHNNEEIIWKDQYKHQWCKDNGIELMIINHKDWIKNKDFGMINGFINH